MEKLKQVLEASEFTIVTQYNHYYFKIQGHFSTLLGRRVTSIRQYFSADDLENHRERFIFTVFEITPDYVKVVDYILGEQYIKTLEFNAMIILSMSVNS